MFSLIILFIITIIITLSFFFHSAEIKIESRTEKLTFLNDVYEASFIENGIEKIEKEKRSIGKIKVINNTNEAQTLKEETRFDIFKEQIVYKIVKRVIIPAKSSIIVDAYSDGVGQKYNKIKGIALKIPGFNEANMFKEYNDIFGEIAEDFYFEEDLKNVNININNKKTLGKTAYEVFEISVRAQEKISSLGIEEKFEKAVGKIKIINTTDSNQRLQKETRFQNNELIFKTYKSVTIPANSFVVADAFADKSGRKYNIKTGEEFVIPGFKESNNHNEYKKITGIAYSDFTGGIIGKSNIPHKEEWEKAKKDLLEKSNQELNIKSKEHIKRKDYIFLETNSFTENIFETESENNNVLVKIKSIKKIPVIKKSDFIQMILSSENNEKKKDLSLMEIKDFSHLLFNILNDITFNNESKESFLFSVNGNAEISWILDQEVFLKKIKGNSIDMVEEDLKDSFNNFNIQVSTFPFWISSLPIDEKNIEIIFKK